MWKCVTAEMGRKIRCFHYGEPSDVEQQQDVNSHRTAEESPTNNPHPHTENSFKGKFLRIIMAVKILFA